MFGKQLSLDRLSGRLGLLSEYETVIPWDDFRPFIGKYHLLTDVKLLWNYSLFIQSFYDV